MHAADPPAALRQHKRQLIDQFARPDNGIALRQVAVTLLPLAACWWLASLATTQGLLWPVLATLLMSFLLLRVFVLMHECGHMSLFASPQLNRAFGFLFGVISGMPQYVWSQHHNFHHSTNGNWDQYRGPLATLSTAEYDAMSATQQQSYVRNRKIWMAPLGGLMYMIISPRVNWIRGSLALLAFIVRDKRNHPEASLQDITSRFAPRYWTSAAQYRHMSLNNVVLLSLWVLMCWWLGPLLFFTVYLISGALAGGAGIILFTVQHNFEHAYAGNDEDWDYDTAALEGTSFLQLPGWLNWCTANIGYHHIHHLSARIPNYRLAGAHARYQPVFGAVPRLHLRDILPSLRCVLWDRQQRRIISVAEHRSGLAAA